MTQYSTVYVCGLLLVCSVRAQLQCGPKEQQVECAPKCAADYCPRSEGVQPCPPPSSCPAPTCKCLFDHSRAENGTCIPTKDCPPFECSRPNEEYDSCPPACSDDCSMITSKGECRLASPFFLIALPCSPSCRCARGYGRRNGTCVPYAQCFRNN